MLSLIAPYIAMYAMECLFPLVLPPKEYDSAKWDHEAELDIEAENIDDLMRGHAKWQWELAAGIAGITVAAIMQRFSLLFGMRLARYWPRALWWVVPQMVLLLSVVGVLTVSLLFIVFGNVRTALHLLPVVALSIPVVVIGVIGFTIWWTRSVLRSAKADQINGALVTESRPKQGQRQ